MARDRSDLRWQHYYDKDDAWQRLKWARETHGQFPNKTSFAKRVGEAPHTYRTYERPFESGNTNAARLDFEKAVKWADVLDVRWEWLLRGEGLPWRDDEPQKYSAEALDLAATVDRLPEETRRARVQAIKALLTGTDN